MSAEPVFFVTVAAMGLAAGAAFGIPMFRARRGDRAAGNGVYQSIAVSLAVVLAAVLLYARFGSPHLLTPISTEALLRAGAPDDAALERLKTHLARNRDDARGWVLAARAYAAREQLKEAAGAYARAIAASAKVGQDAEVLSEYADILGAIAGTLKGRPERLLTEALALNPRHRKAMELAGSAALERNDYAAAIMRWEALAAELPTGDPLAPRLAGAIEKARERAQRSRIYGDVIDAP